MRSTFDVPYNEFVQALISMDRVKVKDLLAEANLSPEECANTFIMPALDYIGAEWDSGRLALSQVYIGCSPCWKPFLK